MQHGGQQESGAEQDKPGFEPEFVSSDARAEDLGDADSVRNDQSEQDGPENVFNVGSGDMVRANVSVDGGFHPFAAVSDESKQSDAGNKLQPFLRRIRRRTRESNRTGHEFSFRLPGHALQ